MCAVAAIIVGALIFWPTKSDDKIIKDDDFLNEYNNDTGDLKNFDPINESFAKDKKPKDLTKGSNEIYSWSQSDAEIELFVPVTKSTKSKDILIDILTTGIVLSVAGNVLIDGDFYDEVKPSESNWQLDDENNKRIVWITLTKKRSTPINEYWENILQDDVALDDELDNEALEKPLDELDTDDFRKVFNKMKKKSS